MMEHGDRVVDCPHRAACGACGLLQEPYAAQLERKRQWLTEALAEHIRCAPDTIRPTLASPRIEGYRNRAKMTLSSDRNRKTSLGYFARRSREVVDAIHCGVLVPELLETTQQLRTMLNGLPTVPYALRHIDLRCGSDPTSQHLTLVVKEAEMPRLPIEVIARACPHVAGIAVNLNPGAGPQVIRGRIEPVAGVREVFVQSAGLSLRISAGSFFQVNLEILPEIHAAMADFLGNGDLLFDLYAGVGTHGLALRGGFRQVVCVEGMRSSVADARASIKAGRVANVEILSGTIRRSARRLAAGKPSAIVINPSRVGAEPAVLDLITESSARRLAYLSCNPETLARDLARLNAGGFEPVSVRAVDMMPQTRQVEALALLERRRGPK